MWVESRDGSPKIRSPRRLVPLACAAIGAALWFVAAAQAQLTGPLRAFQGTWAGGGTLSHQSGVTERIRCDVGYVPRGRQTIRQTLSCHGDTSNFNIVSNVTDDGGRLTGDWTETSHDVRGTLTGTLRGGSLRAQVQGPGFSAGVGIGVRGNRQTVSIRAAGAEITGLTIALTRTGR